MIPVAKPWIGEEEAEAVRRPLLSGWVTQGPEVAAFEREFAEYVGAPHACAVSNCTTALHLALKAVGAGLGDEVVTVSHSFIATANVVRYVGATPVFVDIDPATFNIDPMRIEAAIGPRTRAILCVHQMGMPCDLGSILPIARAHGIPVIEDAACASGSEILLDGSWQRIGQPHGDIACFSFHPRKLLTTGDGGMITTKSAEWDREFRQRRQHCMDVSDTARHTAGSVMFETYPELGFNYRMTDLQAAMGRVQLTRLPEIISRRRAQAARYRELLSGIEGLTLPQEPAYARSNWQSFCVRLPEHCDQVGVMQAMLDDGVSTRRGIMNSHREPAYLIEPWRCESDADCDHAHGHCTNLKESDAAQERSIILPLFHEMTEAEQNCVIESLTRAVAGSGNARAKLAA